MMSKAVILIGIIILLIPKNSYSQNFQINTHDVVFDGKRLSISYDINAKKQTDVFYIAAEILKQDGTLLRAKSLKGDIGESITSGKNKNIIWYPLDDNIFLNDTVTVEIFGERYEKEFNKGSTILMSTILPGLGQTRISKGKPWWLTGIAAYGTLAGGFVFYSSYLDTFDTYKTETDPVERSDLFDQSQKQKNLAGALFTSAAVLWLGNIIWVAATPNREKPLKLDNLAITTAPIHQGRAAMLSLKFSF